MRRFSIAALMSFVLVSGVALAALRYASDTWAGVLILVTLFWLATALIGVIHRRAARRAFWQGFALFGWGYGVLAFGPWFAEDAGLRLPTVAVLDLAFDKISPPDDPVPVPLYAPIDSGPGAAPVGAGIVGVPPGNPLPPGLSGLPVQLASPPSTMTAMVVLAGNTRDQFVRVGQCLFTILAALLGAGLACWFHRSNRDA